MLRKGSGDRLTVPLGARRIRASLTLNDDAPLRLTARRARAAIFTATVRADGAITGTAPGGGVLGAHLSGLGLVGALALPGTDAKTFTEPDFASAPLHVDGRPVPFPPDRAAEAYVGDYRFLVTLDRIVGATTKFIDLSSDLAIPAGTKFIEQDIGF